MVNYAVAEHKFIASNLKHVRRVIMYNRYFSVAWVDVTICYCVEWSGSSLSRGWISGVCVERWDWGGFLVVHRQVHSYWQLATKHGMCFVTAFHYRDCNEHLPRVGPGQSPLILLWHYSVITTVYNHYNVKPPYPFTSPPTQSFSTFHFSFPPFLLALSIFLLFRPFPFCQNSPTLFPGQLS